MTKKPNPFPWETLEKGQGFFIPALDLDTVRELGLKAALKVRVLDAQAEYCLYRGLIGVLFHRVLPVPRKPPKSSTAAKRQEPPASPQEKSAPHESDAQPS